MKLTVYTYFVDGANDPDSGTYVFATEAEREAAIKLHLPEIACNVELEGLDSIDPDDLEDELQDYLVYINRDECVIDMPILGELVDALDNMLDTDDGPIVGDGWDNPWVAEARAVRDKAKGLK